MKSLEMPNDVKFVNILTNLFFGLFILLMIANTAQYLVKNAAKNLGAIKITGDTTHSSASIIKNSIFDDLNGNFYSMHLVNTQKAFESMSWVKKASVKRVYPNMIEVKLGEYKPMAVWGARENMQLLDESGIIFEASTEEDEFESLPQLIGSEDQAKLMLDMYAQVSGVLAPLKNNLKVLELTDRGSWIATLDSGTHIELGRGTSIDVMSRVTKFAITTEKMLTKLNKKSTDFHYVDLRHSDGYALRMQGVSTLDSAIPTTLINK